MAPRKTKTPNIKIEPPPPPPIALDAVGRISVRPPSSLLCSDDEPATKSEPKLATKPPIQLKQQTIMSSYHGAHKAAIIKLLKEDSDIQDTIVNSGWFQSKLKTAVLQLLQSDGDIKIAMNRHAVNRHTKSDTPSFGIESKSDPPPQEETPSKLPEKHTIALDAVGRISVRTPSSLLFSDSPKSYVSAGSSARSVVSLMGSSTKSNDWFVYSNIDVFSTRMPIRNHIVLIEMRNFSYMLRSYISSFADAALWQEMRSGICNLNNPDVNFISVEGLTQMLHLLGEKNPSSSQKSTKNRTKKRSP